jgi:hypothetical protein
MVRQLISGVFLETGERWWKSCVSKNIRDKAENRKDEEKRLNDRPQ